MVDNETEVSLGLRAPPFGRTLCVIVRLRCLMVDNETEVSLGLRAPPFGSTFCDIKCEPVQRPAAPSRG